MNALDQARAIIASAMERRQAPKRGAGVCSFCAGKGTICFLNPAAATARFETCLVCGGSGFLSPATAVLWRDEACGCRGRNPACPDCNGLGRLLAPEDDGA